MRGKSFMSKVSCKEQEIASFLSMTHLLGKGLRHAQPDKRKGCHPELVEGCFKTATFSSAPSSSLREINKPPHNIFSIIRLSQS
jgi:hypothetical protein